MKLFRQILSIVLVILIFLSLDLAIYNIVTRRLINHTSEGMQAKSVELDKYLPFDPNSQIARVDSTLKLEGDLPTLDGAAALYPIFSAFVAATYPVDSVCFDGESFTADSALHYTNTRGAYKAIVDGDADIIICVAPSDAQLAYAAENGVELEFIPIGREAFVFIVNKDNPVDGLTTEQLKGIYSGQYTSWSEVGGDNYPIDALVRNPGSGSQSAMENFMGDEQIKRHPLGFLGRAIGFSFRFYVSDIVANGGVKMLSLDGVYPDEENVANGSYPIENDIYAIRRKNEQNENVALLIDWMLSVEGQKIVKESGYVPLK